MLSFEPEDVLYFGDDLKVTSAYFEYKGKIYATNYIFAVEKSMEKAKRPWDIPLAIGGVISVLYAIRSLWVLHGMNGTMYVMLFWLVLSSILLFWAYRYYITNIPIYKIVIHMSMQDPIIISFADDEYDRDDAFQSLQKALGNAQKLKKEIDDIPEEDEEEESIHNAEAE